MSGKYRNGSGFAGTVHLGSLAELCSSAARHIPVFGQWLLVEAMQEHRIGNVLQRLCAIRAVVICKIAVNAPGR
jgi:hypothetical protein